MRKLITLSFCLLLACLPLCAAGTIIADTIRTPFGGLWNGSIKITCPSGVNAAGQTIGGFTQSITVINGAFRVTIDPGDAGSPKGRTCSVTRSPALPGAQPETWLVPTSTTPLKIPQVQAGPVPAPPAQLLPTQIAQGGATLNQAMCWLGLSWGPGTCGGTWGQITGNPALQLDMMALFADKADTTHTHAESDVTGLVTDLAGKTGTGDPRLSDARTPLAHTQAASTISDFQTAVSANVDVSAAKSAQHAQGSDQGLDTGGANAVTAAQAKTAYGHSQATGNSHGATPADIGAEPADANIIKKDPATGIVTSGTTALDPVNGVTTPMVRVDPGLLSKPACTVAVRGAEWITYSGVGVVDVVEVCRKGVTNAYSWVPESLSVTLDSTPVGSQPVLNFQVGTGIVLALSDTGSAINEQTSVDTAVIETRSGAQAAQSLKCAPSSASGTTYTCGLSPAAAAYPTGATTLQVILIPDVVNTGAVTLNVDGRGARKVLKRSGATLAAGDLAASTPYLLLYSPAADSAAGAWTVISMMYAQSYVLTLDGTTTALADGSTVTWTCGSGSGAQCTTNWIVPAGVNWVRVDMWAGGAGGGAGSGANENGGGGGGGYASRICAVTPGSTFAIAAGLGGPGQASYATGGNAGGNSSAGTCVTVTGGSAVLSTTSGTYGGGLSGLTPAYGYISATPALVTQSATYNNSAAGYHSLRLDLGGSGASQAAGAAAGGAGGSSQCAGGGGGSGGNANATGGAGGISGCGGNGGAGGGWTSGGGLVACQSGAIPGGGGGGAGTGETGVTHAGCVGGRGEVRLYYTR
jgi:hypothetical protein